VSPGVRLALRRVALAVPTAFAVAVISFTLIHVAPGDPVQALAGDGGDEAYYADMRARFGLDRPLPAQFVSYLGRLATGDFGFSWIQGRPVRTMIAERLPATLLLTGTALVASTLIGIALGTYAAARHRRAADTGISTLTILLFATPSFWLGQLALLWLALRLRWFPVQGMTDLRGEGGRFDLLWHLVLPAVTTAAVLAAQEVAAVCRLLRNGLLDELDTAHVLLARAKGLPERMVLRRHALRRPLIPVLAVIGGRLGQLLSGAVVVEIVFGWPGVGRLLLTAMQSRDIPVVMGVFLLTALTVIAANLLIDLVVLRLDPRIGRTGGRS